MAVYSQGNLKSCRESSFKYQGPQVRLYRDWLEVKAGQQGQRMGQQAGKEEMDQTRLIQRSGQESKEAQAGAMSEKQ